MVLTPDQEQSIIQKERSIDGPGGRCDCADPRETAESIGHFGETSSEAAQTHHVTVTYDGANQRVQINGESDDSRAQTGSV